MEKEQHESECSDGQEDQKIGADRALGEAVDAAEDAAPGRKRAQDDQGKGEPDQSDIPDLQNAALLLDDDTVEESGRGQPGQKTCVFDGVPRPVAAPAQFHVSPLAAHDNAGREEHPRDQRPAAHGPHPAPVEPFAQQRGHGKGEGYGQPDPTQIEHDRMNDHPVVLEQWVEPASVGRHDADLFKGVCAEDEQHEEEEQRRQQGRIDVGHEGALGVAKGQGRGGAEKPKQERPEEKAACLAAPYCGKLVEGW